MFSIMHMKSDTFLFLFCPHLVHFGHNNTWNWDVKKLQTPEMAFLSIEQWYILGENATWAVDGSLWSGAKVNAWSHTGWVNEAVWCADALEVWKLQF